MSAADDDGAGRRLIGWLGRLRGADAAGPAVAPTAGGGALLSLGQSRSTP